MEQAAPIAVRTICEFLRWTQVVKTVTMVCRDDRTLKAYQDALEAYQAEENS